MHKSAFPGKPVDGRIVLAGLKVNRLYTFTVQPARLALGPNGFREKHSTDKASYPDYGRQSARTRQ